MFKWRQLCDGARQIIRQRFDSKLAGMEAVASVKSWTLPKKVEIRNEKEIMGIAGRLEPMVQSQQPTQADIATT